MTAENAKLNNIAEDVEYIDNNDLAERNDMHEISFDDSVIESDDLNNSIMSDDEGVVEDFLAAWNNQHYPARS